jgi:hypothetical protein
MLLAKSMYLGFPYARDIGPVGEAAATAAGVALSAEDMEGHDVSTDVLTSVLYWLHGAAVLLKGWVGPDR